MKVGRQYVGKEARVVWRDPCSAHVTSHTRDRSDVPRGVQVLAIQIERGLIDDVTEGVVRIVHTEGKDSALVPDASDDLYCTWVPEALIERIVILEPKEDQPEA